MGVGGFVGRIWTGATEMADGVAGFVTDVAEAATEAATLDFTDAAETLYTSVQEDLMGDVFGGAFGPEGVGGTLIGALPEQIRSPGRAILTPTFEKWQWVIDEVVDRPLGTMFTVVNAVGSSGINEMFELDTWREAYAINDARTFGQSLAATIYNIDPFNEEQYNSIRDDPLFNLISGTADFVQEFVDPVALATGGTVGLARGSLVAGKVGRSGAAMFTPTRVFGRGTGITGVRMNRARYHAAEEGTRRGRQYAAAQETALKHTTARVDHFIRSPRFQAAQEAMDRASDYAGRHAAFTEVMGPAIRSMPPDAVTMVARGPTAAARELNMRIASGEIHLLDQVRKRGQDLVPRLDDPDFRAALARRDELYEQIRGTESVTEEGLRVFTDEAGVRWGSAADDTPVRKGDVAKINDDSNAWDVMDLEGLSPTEVAPYLSEVRAMRSAAREEARRQLPGLQNEIEAVGNTLGAPPPKNAKIFGGDGRAGSSARGGEWDFLDDLDASTKAELRANGFLGASKHWKRGGAQAGPDQLADSVRQFGWVSETAKDAEAIEAWLARVYRYLDAKRISRGQAPRHGNVSSIIANVQADVSGLLDLDELWLSSNPTIAAHLAAADNAYRVGEGGTRRVQRLETATPSPETIAARAEIAGLDEVVRPFLDELDSVDWATLYDIDLALRRAQQHGVEGVADGYRFNPNIELTLNSAEDVGMFRLALDEIINADPRNADIGRRPPLTRGLETIKVTRAPYGRGLAQIADRARAKMDTLGVSSHTETYRNPEAVLGGSRFRVLTEKLPQTFIDFRDPVNATTQFRRMLTQANRVRPDDKVLIDAADTVTKKGRTIKGVETLVAEFSDAVLMRDYDRMRSIYENTVNRLIDDFDRRSPATFERLREQFDHAQRTFDASAKHTFSVRPAAPGQPGIDANIFRHMEGDDIYLVATHVDETAAAPLMNTSQVQTQFLMPRWHPVNRQLRQIKRRTDPGTPTRLQHASQVVNRSASGVMGVWRTMVLLTPKWPMRVGLDEQLRIMAQLGTMDSLGMFARNMPDLSRALAAKSIARHGKSVDTYASIDNITGALDNMLLEHGFPVDFLEDGDIFSRLRHLEEKVGRQAADEAVAKVYRDLAKDALRDNTIRRTAIAGLKGAGVGAVFGGPLGVAYWGLSFASRRRRIIQAIERNAGFQLGDAIAHQGRRMLREAVDPEQLADLEALIRRGDEISDTARALGPQTVEAVGVLNRADEIMAEAGFPHLRVNGYRARGAYGDLAGDIEHTKRLTSATGSMDHLFHSSDGAQRRALARWQAEDWTRHDVLKQPAKFSDNYANTMQQATTQGEFNRFYEIVWDNSDISTRADDLADLLASDYALRERLGIAGAGDDLEVLREIAEDFVSEYESLLPSGGLFDDLRVRAANGDPPRWNDVNSRVEELARQWDMDPVKAIESIRRDYGRVGFGYALGPDDLATPNTANAATGLGVKIREATESLFETLGTQVTDNVARNPYYRARYDAEVTRRLHALTDGSGDAVLSQRQILRVEEEARRAALADLRNLLYDLAEETRFGEMASNLIPFYNAWGEVLSRWGNLATQNPYFVANAGRIYSKPWDAETLGITEVTDEDSGAKYLMFRWVNPTDESETGARTVWESMPDSVRNILLPEGMEDPDRVLRFSKDGLASMMQSTTPGFGPLVTIPVREAVLANPTLEETFEFMFPFGHPDGGMLERLRDGFLPTWMRAVDDIFRDTPTDERMTLSMMVDYVTQRAEAGDPIDLGDPLQVNAAVDEAHRRAEIYHKFRAAAGLFSPTSATLISPYQPLIDIARKLQREHGNREGNRIFLAEYGEELFALTGRMTQLNDGVAATLDAEELYMKHQKLIQAHPSIGAFLSGSIGSTDEQYVFSNAVYRRQRNMAMSSTDDRRRRDLKTPLEYVSDTQAELGWTRFSEMQDVVRNEQDRRRDIGLPSHLNSKSMEAVRAWKNKKVLELAEKYPAWWNEYNDFGASDRRMREIVDGFAAALQDQQVLARPSTNHVIEYFQLRNMIQAALQERKAQGGSDNLGANSNADLWEFFEMTKEELGGRPEFSRIYDRYFARDRLRPATFWNADVPILEVA